MNRILREKNRALKSHLPPTKTQMEVFDFIKSCIAQIGYPPTHREIAAHFKWTSNAAAKCHLLALEKKGYVKIHIAVARGLVVLK